MLTLKYLLEAVGFALLAAAAVTVLHDYLRRNRHDAEAIGWRNAAKLSLLAMIPLLIGLSVQVVPAGMAGVRVSQISGTLQGTIYPGFHLVIPLVQTVTLYDVRDQVSGARSAQKESGLMSSAVRQTPLTETLSPVRSCFGARPAAMLMRRFSPLC